MSKNLKESVELIQFLKKMTVAEIAASIGYSRVHLQKAMKRGNENLKRLLVEKYPDILQEVSKSKQSDATKKPGEPDYRELYITQLKKENERLDRQISLATGELRHIAIMNYAMLQTLRKAVAQVLAKQEKATLLQIAERLDKETAAFYDSAREKGSLIDADI